MTTPLLRLEIRFESDVVLCRQRARQLAELLGFGGQDQVRIATAVSELARNAYQYAGGGRVRFDLAAGEPQLLRIDLRDTGPGIAELDAILENRYVSKTGMGRGITGARRLMDGFRIKAPLDGGTHIVMEKQRPPRLPAVSPAEARRIAAGISAQSPQNPFEEIQRQNQELLAALAEGERQARALDQLNRELEETNRGVVALYAELDERASLLEQSSEHRTRFFSDMTHEFRTPLNSITNISQLLLDRIDGELTGEQEMQVRFIRAGAQSLNELVNDLLDLAKIEAGKLTVRPARFEVEAMFGMLRGMLRPLFDIERGVALVFEAAGDIPAMESDEGKISQILRNLVSNGLKFTPSGEVRVGVERGEADYLVFTVRDTGIGIAYVDQERVFEEYTQIEGAPQTMKGTGLGLPLSRRLAQALGGTITLESAVGRGSTFRLEVPRCYAPPVEASPPRVDGTVLIIDDGEADRYMLKKRLARVASDIVEAVDGEEGLRLARIVDPALIFLDGSMPGLSGAQVLSRLKGDPATARIPVIFHSSQDFTPGEAARLAQDAIAVLSKSLGEEAFHDRIGSLLRNLPLRNAKDPVS